MSPVMEEDKTSLLQGVVLEELKLCQARAVTWQSKCALIGQTSHLPHPFMSTQVPPSLPLAVPPDGHSHPLPRSGCLCGRPHLWVLKEVS